MNQREEFLQSENWLLFQEANGKTVMRNSSDGFGVNGIIHQLPLAGKYLYIPRGSLGQISKLTEEAKKRKVKWIRMDPEREEILEEIKKTTPYKIVKAPHDMQPKEIFVIDITKDEAVLLAEMKSKTRYNIRLAEKHGVRVFATREEKYKQTFFDLIQATADRKEISPHPKDYYAKFFDAFSSEMCQLFVAEYEGKVLAANILIMYRGRAIYLHGGSSDDHRDVMAPFLLQWEQIRYAKEHSCTEYDFGGVRTQTPSFQLPTSNSWSGITRFKLGFSPHTSPTVFPGSYDMILDSRAYFVYNFLRRSQEIIRSLNIFR